MDEVKNIGGKCECTHHSMGAWAVALIGLTFLLGAFDVLSSEMVSIIWPILLIIGAFMKICSSKCKCCNS